MLARTDARNGSVHERLLDHEAVAPWMSDENHHGASGSGASLEGLSWNWDHHAWVTDCNAARQDHQKDLAGLEGSLLVLGLVAKANGTCAENVGRHNAENSVCRDVCCPLQCDVVGYGLDHDPDRVSTSWI